MSVRAELETDGLRCASCAYAVERLGGKIPGVEGLRVDAATGRIILDYDGDERVLGRIAELVARLGHEVRPS